MYKFFRALFRFVFSFFFRWRVVGRENIPQDGPVILCSNHISNWDPPLLGSGIERQVNFMAKEELFKIPVLGWLITQFGAFPVKRGGGDRSAIRSTLQLLESGKILGIFPEGTRSKTGELGKGMPGTALFALRSNAVVIPVAIIGPYQLFRPVTIVYGKPVDLTEFKEAKGGSDTVTATTDHIMRQIQQLIDTHKA